ncbi:MAG: HK97 family phage prohead protease [Actinomycetota bacterium]|nr:HK97 family phage prohead protease [Actinomycetota bacterium]
MDTKHIGVVDLEVKTPDEEDGPGTFEAVLSAPTKDRDNEIIDVGAFEPLPDRIVIDVDHGMSTLATVGSGEPFYDGGVLKIRGAFSSVPRAQEVRTLVREGHVRSMSVAFMGAQREDDDDGVPHIKKAELLNAAFVAIPANREAAVLAAKSTLKVGARNSAEDQRRMQELHTLACELGAECGEKGLDPSGAHKRSEAVPADHAADDAETISQEAIEKDADPEQAAASAAASPADASLGALITLAQWETLAATLET